MRPSGSDTRSQSGFTLIELMIATVIGTLILAAVGWSILELFQMNARNVNHMTAVQQVQNVGYWFSRDAEQAPSDPVDPPDSPWISTNDAGTTLYLKWRDMSSWPSSANGTSTITWDPLDQTITRSYDGGTPAPIARDITSASFTLEDAEGNVLTSPPDVVVSKVIMVVTANVTSRGLSSTETRTYEASPRPGQAQ